MAALVEEGLAVLELAAKGEVAGVVDGVVLRIRFRLLVSVILNWI